MVRNVPCLHDDELLPGTRKKATPDKKSEKEGNGDITTRFNVLLFAEPNDHDDVHEPGDGIYDVGNDATCAAKTDVHVTRIIIIGKAIGGERIWVKAATRRKLATSNASGIRVTCTPRATGREAGLACRG